MKDGTGSTDSTPTSGGTIAQRRLLVVEDNIEVAEVICEWFNLQEAIVTVAHRGAEALQHVMRSDFDAIICDMVMPQMPGDMFYLAVERVKPHMCRRFVFITGFRDHPDVSKFLWQYCGPTLDKPLSMDELTRAVESVISQPRVAANFGA